MRRLLVSLISIVILVAIGFALGKFLPLGDADGGSQQQIAPQIVTVPILITATTDPNVTPEVIIVTATPLPGSISALPTDLFEGEGSETRTAVPTIDPESLGGDSVAQATVAALPENCIVHVMVEGDTPFGVAEIYDANGFDLLEVNGLDDETSRFLDVGDVLIVPLEGCPLSAAQVAAVTGGTGTELAEETPTAENGDEATQEATQEAEPTVVPTITLPPTAVNAQVQIVRVISAGDITAEGIEIRNTGGVVDLTDWTLEDADGNVFTFPEQRLFTNGLVTVYTRRGTNTPIALYWGRSQAVWGEPGDSVTLADKDGDAQATLRLDAPVSLSGN